MCGRETQKQGEKEMRARERRGGDVTGKEEGGRGWCCASISISVAPFFRFQRVGRGSKEGE